MLQDFNARGLFDEPTYQNARDGGHEFKIVIEPGGKAPFRSPYRISPREEAELRRQIEKALRNGWITPSSSNYGLPVLFVPKGDGSLAGRASDCDYSCFPCFFLSSDDAPERLLGPPCIPTPSPQTNKPRHTQLRSR
jgi:hypothetical protein